MINSGDLLRQAEEKELLASRFEAYGENLVRLLEQVKVRSVGGDLIWTGPAAQRFDHDKRQRHAEVDRLVEQCERAALGLRNTAQRIRQQARQPRTPF